MMLQRRVFYIADMHFGHKNILKYDKRPFADTEQMDEDVFDDMLDECYEEVQICGLSYSPSYALYSIDKVAYKEAMYDYYDSLASDMEYTIERMDSGEEEDFYGCTVQCVDDDAEEEENTTEAI